MQDGTSGDFPAISPNYHVANANVVNKRDPTLGKPRIDQIPDLTPTAQLNIPNFLSAGQMKIV